ALGSAQPDVEHVDARVSETLDECIAQARAREPDIASHRHPLRLHELREPAPDPVGDVFVELIRETAADVVSLEAGDFHGARWVGVEGVAGGGAPQEWARTALAVQFPPCASCSRVSSA